MNIYVANIPFKAAEADLKELFEQHGEVISAKIVIDKMTNRSRGFGFVEMTDHAAANEAISKLNGKDFMGKDLAVNEARPKIESTGGGNRSGSFNKRY